MSERSPEELLWDFLRGAMATRALAIVADLGVAESLAAGPRHVRDLAPEVGADPDTLHRLLRALASDGVFAEDEPGVFRNTEASTALRPGGGWDDFAHLFGDVWHRAVGELDAGGEATFPALHGTDFWSWLGENPAERAAFDRAMVGGSENRVERLAGLDWRGDELVVDVGGGNGSLLVKLLPRLPDGIRGIVFDLPETNRDEAAFGDRLAFVAGDFFDRVPAGDVYVLASILHDWDDERCAAILGAIGAAAGQGARLLVLESVIAPGNERDGAKWLDLLMLALARGRERDEAQWRALLSGAGFEPVSVRDGLIEARWR